VQYRTLTIGGQRTRVAEVGSGPPLILLASPLVLARSYRRTARRLAQRFRVIVVEVPGCGGGSVLARPWFMQQYADWLPGLFDALEIGRPTVIGHSNSGAIALLLAARHPQRIDRLILADGIGFDRRHSLPRILLGRAIDCFFEFRLSLTAWHHVVYNVLRHWRNFWQQVRLSASTDLCEEARHVTTPTLLAWGAHDHTVPPFCGQLARELLPNAELHVSQSGSHDWSVDMPDEFARTIEAWMARNTVKKDVATKG
jgi:pimeloyl-ACP methyl ester carboxylesterase